MSGGVRETLFSFAITLSAQPISYDNQHSLTQPYCKFLPFLLIFCPNKICLNIAFTFILLTYNNTIKSVLLKARKNKRGTKHFFHKKKNFQFAQSTNKKQIHWRSWLFLLGEWTLLPLNNTWLENSFEWFHWPYDTFQKVFSNTTFFSKQLSYLRPIFVNFSTGKHLYCQLIVALERKT